MARSLEFERPLRHLVGYYFIGMYFSLLLPTSVGGDVVRAWYLDGGTRRRLGAFATVFLDRLSGLIVLLAMACLSAFAKEQRLSASQFTALGAFRDCVLGYFDWQQKDYRPIPIDEQVEVLALLGVIALDGRRAEAACARRSREGGRQRARRASARGARAPDARSDHHRVAGPSAAPLGPRERARADRPLILLIPRGDAHSP